MDSRLVSHLARFADIEVPSPAAGARRGGTPDLCVVVPAHNEEANLAVLVREVERACGEAEIGVELLIVDDGSRDNTATVIRAIAVMDADLQDRPADLVALYRRWEEGADVVYAVRRPREEHVLKLVSFSAAPLRLATVLGLAVSGASFVGAAVVLVWKISGRLPEGFGLATIALSVLCLRDPAPDDRDPGRVRRPDIRAVLHPPRLGDPTVSDLQQAVSRAPQRMPGGARAARSTRPFVAPRAGRQLDVDAPS